MTLQIDFTGHHMEITDALRNVTSEKLQKLAKLKHHFDIKNIHVTFSKEKIEQVVGATLHLPGHGKIAATARNEDMYVAIDQLVEKLHRQLVNHKEKDTDHR